MQPIVLHDDLGRVSAVTRIIELRVEGLQEPVKVPPGAWTHCRLNDCDGPMSLFECSRAIFLP